MRFDLGMLNLMDTGLELNLYELLFDFSDPHANRIKDHASLDSARISPRSTQMAAVQTKRLVKMGKAIS
ncbi:MAG: hypothetical protein AB8B94_20680 [Hyphomicrobiales bacterium]